MNIRHLQIFICVCDHDNSITKAAKSLFMTQPSVTQAVQELENHYGVRLFDRISRRLYLTAAGAEFEKYARRLVGLYDDMEKRFTNWDGAGALRIGASMTIGTCMMPQMVSTFQNRFPGTKVQVVVEPSRFLEQKLRSNEIDAALVETPVHSEVLCSEKFGEDSLCVIAAPQDSYMAGSGDPVLKWDIETFLKSSFLLREAGSGSREIFDQLMHDIGQSIEPVWEAQSTSSLIHAVSQGMGICVLPRLLAREALLAGQVREVNVTGLHFKQTFYIVYHKDKLITPLLKAFFEIVTALGGEQMDARNLGSY